MKKTLNIGVVGLGYWGPNLARNFDSLDDCHLKTVCDLSVERLKHITSLYPSVTGENDFEKLLQDPELDAIVIATAVRTHYPLAKASLLAGKHTLIEKPLAGTSEQCEELVSIAREKGLILMVGHTFLYSPAIRKIKEIVDSGNIGEIRYISSRRLNLGIFQNDINVAWDLAPHDLSIILHILGEQPQSVNCQGSAHITPGIEDVTTMSLQFSNQRSAIVQSSWLDPRKVREMTIVGSKRMILYDDIALQEKIKIFDARVETPPHYDTFAEFHYAYHHGDIQIPFIKQEEPLKNECQHFLECIRNDRTPLTCGQNGAEVVRILEASSKSLKQNGASITLQSKTDKPNQGSISIAPFFESKDPSKRVTANG
jgi:predicted dehydrogenase